MLLLSLNLYYLLKYSLHCLVFGLEGIRLFKPKIFRWLGTLLEMSNYIISVAGINKIIIPPTKIKSLEKNP